MVTFPCCAAPPIQNLEAVSLGVVMTNSMDCSSYVACVSMPMTFEPCPSSVILQPAQDSAPDTVHTSRMRCCIGCWDLVYHPQACVHGARHKDVGTPEAAWQIQGIESRQELGMVLLCSKLGDGACVYMRDQAPSRPGTAW